MTEWRASMIEIFWRLVLFLVCMTAASSTGAGSLVRRCARPGFYDAQGNASSK